MALYHILLGLLSYKPMTGYQIKQMFESAIMDFWDAHISQIYRELSRMEAKGWVTFEIVPQDGKPDKKVYSISQEGTEVFIHWLREFPDNPQDKLRSEFLIRIFFASHINLADLAYELKRFMRKEQALLSRYKEDEKYLRQQHKNGDNQALFQLMSLMRGIKATGATVEWAQECLQLVKEMDNKDQ